MDGHLFDALLRDFSNSRRFLLATALAATGVISWVSPSDAKKKKKKPCKKKCKDGCCTGKHGKCIHPAQQSSTQCGTGGEICRTNCGGGACGAGCDTCCANGLCLDVEAISNTQCGTGGETCFACPSGQTCNAPGEGCCAVQGATCGADGVACCARLGITCGPDKVCCVSNGSPCEHDSDCCRNLSEQICDNGSCAVPSLASCQPGWICQGGFVCPGAATLFRCCAANGRGCTHDHDCCEDEDVCDAGVCKRKRGDVCNEDIVCVAAYPHCVLVTEFGTCSRCPIDQVSTGTDEICCPLGKYCNNADGGRGACCENEGCCLGPDEDGVECGIREHVGTGSCG